MSATRKWSVRQGMAVVASGEVNADPKAVNNITANIAAAAAELLGLPVDAAMLWKSAKDGTGTGHMRPVRKNRVKDGEPPYKAVSA